MDARRSSIRGEAVGTSNLPWCGGRLLSCRDLRVAIANGAKSAYTKDVRDTYVCLVAAPVRGCAFVAVAVHVPVLVPVPARYRGVVAAVVVGG